MAELKILPPPSPNRDKFPFVASVRFGGMDIDVENLDGSTRTGTGPNGKTWKTEFNGAHYGEIRGSKGTDKDAVDVYIKNPPDDSDIVYIVHQNHPGNHPTKAGTFDEDKVILGVKSPEKAKELYLQHYSRKDFFRSLTVMKLNEFKRQIFGESRGEKIAMIKTAQEAYALGVKLALELAGIAKKAAGVSPMSLKGAKLPALAGAQTRAAPPVRPTDTYKPRAYAVEPRPAQPTDGALMANR